MNPRVLRRFVVLMVIAVVAVVLFQTGYDYFAGGAPGDYYVRRGDIRLSEGNHDEALADFDRALAESPNHRGALMGRALVFIQTERYDEAVAELSHLIDYLTRTLEPDDATGQGTLAAAYANRGIIHDRTGRYEEALEDYLRALEADADTVSGPGLVDRILYGYRPSTVRGRAIYLKEQLALPEEERVLRIPELDEEQRMHKP